MPFFSCSKMLGEACRQEIFDNKCSENFRSQILFRTDIFRKLTLGALAMQLLPMRVVFFTLTSAPPDVLCDIQVVKWVTCWTGFVISRSRLWSNFLHWRTNQLLSFHKFPQKIVASCCWNSYPQSWRAVTALISVTFDFAPKAATQSTYKPSTSAMCSSGRTTQTHHQYGGYHLSGRGTLTGSSLQTLNSSFD